MNMELPLFPLSTIVMPGGLLPLRLFEPRYIDMVKDCFKTSTGFGVCLIKDGQDSGVPAEPYPLGTTVSIVDFDQGKDGLLHITAQGEQEFILHSHLVNDAELTIGQIELVEPAQPLEMTAEYASLASKLDMILHYVEPGITYAEKQLDSPDWVCHRLLELLPMASPMKYELLQMPGNRERLDSLSGLKIEFAER